MRVLYFDYPSLPAVVAVLHAHGALVRNRGREIDFGGFDTLGLDVSVPVTLDQREEIDRWRDDAVSIGLEVCPPTIRPATTAAHVIGDLAEEIGSGMEWRQRAIRAYWSDGEDLGDPSVLVELARESGMLDEQVHVALSDTTRHQLVRRRMVAARQRGVGGVPVIDADGALMPANLTAGQWDEMLGHW
ncbi:MAG: DsbA family protein [Nitriliruptoraceae bacterium]